MNQTLSQQLDKFITDYETGGHSLLPNELLEQINPALEKIGYTDEQKKLWWLALEKYWLSKSIEEFFKTTGEKALKQSLFDSIKQGVDVASKNLSESQKFREILARNLKQSLEYFVNLTANPTS